MAESIRSPAWGRWQTGYANGHLESELKGEKLAGRWHLVKMHGKPGEKRENWLLIKADDDAARPADAPDILDEAPASARTGRSIREVGDEAPGWSSRTGKLTDAGKPKVAPKSTTAAKADAVPPAPKGAVAATMPSFVEPALATLGAERNARDASLGLHDIGLGTPGSHHNGPRSGRRRGMAAGHRCGAASEGEAG